MNSAGGELGGIELSARDIWCLGGVWWVRFLSQNISSLWSELIRYAGPEKSEPKASPARSNGEPSGSCNPPRAVKTDKMVIISSGAFLAQRVQYYTPSPHSILHLPPFHRAPSNPLRRSTAPIAPSPQTHCTEPLIHGISLFIVLKIRHHCVIWRHLVGQGPRLIPP